MPDPVDLNLLANLARQTLGEMRDMRRELNDVRTLAMLTSEQTRRLDRRVSELRVDLELMLKSEIMGALTHFETRMKRSMSTLVDRVEALETRPS